MITIAAQRTALQAVFEGISGVTRVFAYTPNEIQPAQLPCVILGPMRADYDRENRGSSSIEVTRDWEALFLTQNLQRGIEYSAEKSAEAFVEACAEALAPYQVLETADGVAFDVYLTGDSGVVRQQFNSVEYAGVVIYFQTVTTDYIESV